MRSNILKCSLPVTLVALIFGIGEVATEAIAAIYRAAAFDQQKRPVVVLFMQQTWHYAVLFFQRVGGRIRATTNSSYGGNYLTQKPDRSDCLSPLRSVNERGTLGSKQLFGAASGQQFSSASIFKRRRSSSGWSTSASCVNQSSLDGVFRVTICAILWLSYQLTNFRGPYGNVL